LTFKELPFEAKKAQKALFYTKWTLSYNLYIWFALYFWGNWYGC
jgi:hypothetical protein